MACCELERIDNSAATSAGNGKLRVRVKAFGESGCRANRANSAEEITAEKSASRACVFVQYLVHRSSIYCQESICKSTT
jgi:hypothetical protein